MHTISHSIPETPQSNRICGVDGLGIPSPAGRTGMPGPATTKPRQQERRVGEDQQRVFERGANRSGNSKPVR